MDWEEIRQRWSELKTRAQQRWNRFTEEDLEAIAGQRDALISKLEERYTLTKEEAGRMADEFAESLKEATAQARGLASRVQGVLGAVRERVQSVFEREETQEPDPQTFLEALQARYQVPPEVASKLLTDVERALRAVGVSQKSAFFSALLHDPQEELAQKISKKYGLSPEQAAELLKDLQQGNI
jgi:uncharacterized protein YjbJ (UPF0337 family)